MEPAAFGSAYVSTASELFFQDDFLFAPISCIRHNGVNVAKDLLSVYPRTGLSSYWERQLWGGGWWLFFVVCTFIFDMNSKKDCFGDFLFFLFFPFFSFFFLSVFSLGVVSVSLTSAEKDNLESNWNSLVLVSGGNLDRRLSCSQSYLLHSFKRFHKKNCSLFFFYLGIVVNLKF